ncbi:hypothetical protein [Sphingomonas sp. SORGH_AS_0870]|uniref:hypothetical protein n=1 Tax=Sphingomonas sp. SORGH_AS_0870 TaxID=3041801 RepID=UPI00286B31C8|nr:hypothetical protein [Sphingomonas sp. SORGH_AS_0870]
MEQARQYEIAGRYWDANRLLERSTFTAEGGVTDPFLFQYWAQFTPFVTNELDPARYDLGRRSAPGDAEWANRIAAAQPRDAIDEIVARARHTRIVILNEAHYSPRDRAFAWQVARALRPLGYDVLAAETFAGEAAKPGDLAPVERLRRDGIVRRDTGFYTHDPVFAGFVRNALALGYRPLAYEQTKAQSTPDGGVHEREQAQADNLLAFLRANPNAKLFVYVGHGHVWEGGSDDPKGGMMAQRLKRMSGIDPLTIEQTSLSDLNTRARPALAVAQSRLRGRPAIFMDGETPLLLGATGEVDIQIVHPARSYRHGRPAWLATLGGRPKAIPTALLPKQGERLVQVFAANAPDDAVPLDQVMVKAQEPAPMLMVPNIPVRFATQDDATVGQSWDTKEGNTPGGSEGGT